MLLFIIMLMLESFMGTHFDYAIHYPLYQLKQCVADLDCSYPSVVAKNWIA